MAIWLFFNTISIRKIKRREKALREAGDNGDFVGAVQASLGELGLMRAAVDDIKAENAVLKTNCNSAVQRVGLVRFDAFEDTGGKLSFAAALLNNHGDGVIISAINGRQESRSYAKLIKGGESEHNLSNEERQAISEALGEVRLASKV